MNQKEEKKSANTYVNDEGHLVTTMQHAVEDRADVWDQAWMTILPNPGYMFPLHTLGYFLAL